MGDTATAVAAPQHLRALEHANRIRLARADLKRRIGAGEVTAAGVLAAPPQEIGSMSISELLMSQRRWGRTKCRRVLLSLGIPENKRIGTLTDRQRQALGRRVAGPGPAQGPTGGDDGLPGPGWGAWGPV